MSAPSTIRLFDAVHACDAATLRDILGAGVDVNALDAIGRTALHYACARGHAELSVLLIRAGADVEARANGGWTALHWAAAYGYAEVVSALVRSGCDVAAQDERGHTPRDVTPLSFRATFDRVVAEAQTRRVCTAAQVCDTPTRPRL